MMENICELNMDEMDKVSGGAGGENQINLAVFRIYTGGDSEHRQSFGGQGN